MENAEGFELIGSQVVPLLGSNYGKFFKSDVRTVYPWHSLKISLLTGNHDAAARNEPTPSAQLINVDGGIQMVKCPTLVLV